MRFFRTFIIIILISLCASLSYCDDSETLKLVIVGDENYPPFEYVDDNGIFKGFNVDIVRAVAIELGIEIDVIPMTWDDAQKSLQEGTVDAIQGMNVTELRKSHYLFSEEIIKMSHSIFVLKDNIYIRDIEDLKGLNVVVQRGDVSLENLSDMKGINIIFRDDQVQCLDALLSGEAEAFIGNTFLGKYYLQKTQQYGKVKIAGNNVKVGDYSMAVNKDSPQTLSILNDGIKRIKKNGTYDKIYKKWFGEYIDEGTDYWKKVLRTVSIFFMFAIVVAFFLFSLNRSKKLVIEENLKTIRGKDLFIRNQEYLNSKIVENMISGLILFDKQGYISAINGSALKFFGDMYNEEINVFDIQEMLGIKGINDCISGEKVFGSVTWKRNDNKVFFFNYNLVPIDNNEEYSGGILTLQDFTKENILEKALEQSNKMKSIGSLVAGISHEIKNPLTAIKVFIDLIPTKINDAKFQNKLYEVMSKEVSRMDKLLVQLLDYAKPQIYKPEMFCVNKLISEINTLFSVNFSSKDIFLEEKGELLNIFADRNSMKQVFINLIMNSFEAVEHCGLIQISYEECHEYGLIKVKNDGKGVPREDLTKVFEPFFTSKVDGYGIGLSMCYQIVVENNGEITIDSDGLSWTEVTIKLPKEALA